MEGLKRDFSNKGWSIYGINPIVSDDQLWNLNQ